jgi:hypothetical protein
MHCFLHPGSSPPCPAGLSPVWFINEALLPLSGVLAGPARMDASATIQASGGLITEFLTKK